MGVWVNKSNDKEKHSDNKKVSFINLRPNWTVTFRDLIKYTDKILFFLTLFISIFGVIIIGSAVNSYPKSEKFIITQSSAIALGIFLSYFVITFGYLNLINLAPILMVFAIFLLFLVLVPGIGIGFEEKGSRSWFQLGSFTFQPSEIAKIVFIISFSKLLYKIDGNINKSKSILKIIFHLLIYIGLVMLEPDAGSALIFVFVGCVLVFFAGIDFRYIIGSVAIFMSSLPFMWLFILKDYQKNRILNFLNPDNDPLGSGYQVFQSKIAIGSGRILGSGFMKGPSNQLGFLPEKHTDFIYSVVGEELGFVGSSIVILVISLIIFRILWIAKKTKDPIGTYVAIGVAGMFTFQMFENIGMCLGLMPVTGITLSFLSYGGSSLLANILAIGLVLSVNFERLYFEHLEKLK